MELGEKARRARKDAGLTQEELAEKTGLSVTTISNIERGVHSPTAANLNKISSAVGSDLGVSKAKGQACPYCGSDPQELLATQQKLYEAERKLNALKDFLSTRYVYEKDWRAMAADLLEKAEELAQEEVNEALDYGEEDYDVRLSGHEDEVQGFVYHHWVPKTVPEVIGDVVSVQKEPSYYSKWLYWKLDWFKDEKTQTRRVRETTPVAREFIRRGEKLPEPYKIVRKELRTAPPYGEWPQKIISRFIDYLGRTGKQGTQEVRDEWWTDNVKEPTQPSPSKPSSSSAKPQKPPRGRVAEVASEKLAEDKS